MDWLSVTALYKSNFRHFTNDYLDAFMSLYLSNITELHTRVLQVKYSPVKAVTRADAVRCGAVRCS